MLLELKERIRRRREAKDIESSIGALGREMIVLVHAHPAIARSELARVIFQELRLARSAHALGEDDTAKRLHDEASKLKLRLVTTVRRHTVARKVTSQSRYA